MSRVRPQRNATSSEPFLHISHFNSSRTGSRRQSDKKTNFETLPNTSTTNLAQSCGTKQPWCSHYNAISRYWIAKHNRTTHNGVRNCSSKTGWISVRKQKNTILKHLLQGILKENHQRQNWQTSSWQVTIAALMQPLQYDWRRSAAKDTSIRMQPRHQATLTQNYNAISIFWIAKHNRTTRNDVKNCSSKTGSRRQNQKKSRFRIPPRAFERRVLLKVEVCYTSSYVHIFTSSHLIIFTNSCMKKYSIFKHQAGDRWLSSRSVGK